MDIAASSRSVSRTWRRIVRLLRRYRTERDEADALRILLARQDDRLLVDAGLDREAGHRLLGEKGFFPGREWDRWQL